MVKYELVTMGDDDKLRTERLTKEQLTTFLNSAWLDPEPVDFFIRPVTVTAGEEVQA